MSGRKNGSYYNSFLYLGMFVLTNRTRCDVYAIEGRKKWIELSKAYGTHSEAHGRRSQQQQQHP